MWQTIKRLNEEIAALEAEGRALLQKGETEKRDLKPEEATAFDGIAAKITAKRAELARYQAVQQQARGNVFSEMKPEEAKRYSLLRAINLRADNKPLDGFEAEVNDELAKRFGKSAQGFFVPFDLPVAQTRAADTTTAAGMKTPVVDTANFIEYLRNKTLVNTLGCRFLNGLVGDVSIPKQTNGATAQWVAEAGAPAGSNATVGQVPLTPKTISAYTDLTRKLVKQTSMDAEAFVRDDLAKAIAIAIDSAAFAGDGSGSTPTGVLYAAGVGSVAMGANGAALDWASVIALETAVANANADVGSLCYCTNAKVRGKAKQTLKAAGIAGYLWADDNTVNGYKACVSNQIPSNLTKGTSNGVCSAAIFGNWNDLIVATWGALDVLVDPYTLSSSGGIRVVTMQDAYVALRHAESFAVVKDLITT